MDISIRKTIIIIVLSSHLAAGRAALRTALTATATDTGIGIGIGTSIILIGRSPARRIWVRI